MLTAMQRLLDVLAGQPVDRPPVVCPGGMMSLAIAEVMDLCGSRWPEAHADPSEMVNLAIAMYEHAGLENVGVPFCMTVEAEALGARVNMGTKTVQPRVVEHPFRSIRELVGLRTGQRGTNSRMGVVVEAIGSLATQMPEVPTVGNLVGPVSLAGSLMEPTVLMREMYRSPGEVHVALGSLVEELIKFGDTLVRVGADVITIAEPTATGEILGPRFFAEFGVPYLRLMVEALHGAGTKVIVHICGDVLLIVSHLQQIGADAISVDEMVNLRQLRAAIAPTAVMGNISAFVLQRGPEGKIMQWCDEIGLRTADIVAPACGLIATTPLAHVQAFAEAIKAHSKTQRI